jgi:hypothetical protein
LKELGLGAKFQQKLFETAVFLNQKVSGKTFPKTTSVQNFFQIFFNLFGMFLGLLFVRWMHPAVANRVTAFIAFRKSARKPDPLDLQSQRNVELTKKILDQFKKGSGKKPALLILISHPELSGDQSYLLSHLIYQAVRINDAISPAAKLKLIQAIDSFALEELPWFIQGVYAGLIAVGHVAMDRQPWEKRFFQKWLFKRFHYTQTIFRIIQELKSGVSLCLALGGGLIQNARIFYTAREFAQRVYLNSLRRGETKLQFEQKIVSLLTKDEKCACITGRLSEDEKENLAAFMKQKEVSQTVITKELKEIEEELGLEMPYRMRFFEILFRRICAKGNPLLLISLTHTPAGKIDFSSSALLAAYNEKNKTIAVLERDDPERVIELNFIDFVKQYVRSSFH